MTARRGGYDPTGHCPAEACSSGKHYCEGIHLWNLPLPDGVTIKENQVVYRCKYCGLMWTQRDGDALGWVRRDESEIVGFLRVGEVIFTPVENPAAYKFDKRHFLSRG